MSNLGHISLLGKQQLRNEICPSSKQNHWRK